MPNQDEIEKLLVQHNRRLQILKEKQAQYGLETPASIITEIEDIEANLENLRKELGQGQQEGAKAPISDVSEAEHKPRREVSFSLKFVIVLVVIAFLLGLVWLFVDFSRPGPSNSVNDNWRQTNIDGFGNANNDSGPLYTFDGQLFAVSYNNKTGVAIHRFTEEEAWSPVSTDGFGNSHNKWIASVAVFHEELYVGVDNTEAGAEVWRSEDGLLWEQSSKTGFNEPKNGRIRDMEVFKDRLYVGTLNDEGGQLWRTSDGDTWEKVEIPGLEKVVSGIYSLASFKGHLYLGTVVYADSLSGSIWRSRDGTNWEPVIKNGFGSSENYGIYKMIVFDDYLYATTENETTGTEVWRTADGTHWQQVNDDGFGNSQNKGVRSAVEFDGVLYVGAINNADGAEIWKTSDGTTWGSVASKGFDDSKNVAIWGRAPFENHLYASTQNEGGDGEVWRLESTSFWSDYLNN